MGANTTRQMVMATGSEPARAAGTSSTIAAMAISHCARSLRKSSTNTRTKVPMASVTTFISGLRMAGPVENTPSLVAASCSLSKWSL